MNVSPAPTTIVICRCGKPFEVLLRVLRQGKGKNCSRACVAAGMAGRPLGIRYQKTCPCGRVFEVTPSKLKDGRGKYCSVPCSTTYRRNPLPFSGSRGREILPETTYRTVPAMRVEGPALPSRAQTLPVIHMRDMAGTWWPSVPRQCRTCGGRMFLRPIDNVDGSIYCGMCARVSFEVRP